MKSVYKEMQAKGYGLIVYDCRAEIITIELNGKYHSFSSAENYEVIKRDGLSFIKFPR